MGNVNTNPDLLQVITSGINSVGRANVKRCAKATLVISKGFNEHADEIEVSTIEHPHNKKITADLKMTFKDGLKWQGNFEELKLGLQAVELLIKICKKNVSMDDCSTEILQAIELLQIETD